MQVKTFFGGQSVKYELKHALLVYEGNDGNCAVTTHKIESYHGRPTITAGQPINVSDLEKLILSLGKSSGASFLPPQVISLGIDRIVWWCPAGRRRIWFKPDNRFEKGLSPEQKDKLARTLKLNGQFVHWPAMLFVAGRGLSVFALAKSERPLPTTPVYKAPCWNLHDGGMCAGNLALPASTADNLTAFENAFFNSSFTHNNAGLLCRHPGGDAGLWEAARAPKPRTRAPDARFWLKNLIRTRHTVASIIKGKDE